MSKKKKGDSVLEHKGFWLVLAVVIMLPLFGVLTGMFTAELAADKSYQTVSFKQAGSELHFEVKKIAGAKEMTIHFVEDAQNMIIEFEELNNHWKFDGTVYSQFKISSEDASKIGKVKFVLKIKEADLRSLGLFKDEVSLYFEGQELETKLTKLEGEYVFYEAKGEGIGEFVIGKAAEEKIVIEEAAKEKETAEIPKEVVPEIVKEKVLVGKASEQPAPVEKSAFFNMANPWLIPLIIFIVFLVVVVYLLKRKKKKQ